MSNFEQLPLKEKVEQIENKVSGKPTDADIASTLLEIQSRRESRTTLTQDPIQSAQDMMTGSRRSDVITAAELAELNTYEIKVLAVQEKIKNEREKLAVSTAAQTDAAKPIEKALMPNEELIENAALNKKHNGVVEVKEALTEINPENLEKAITTSEKFINMLPTGDTQTTLRGVHGAVIFTLLREAGHNIVIQDGQVTIIPKPGADVVNLQEKLQTLVNTNRISLDTIKMGLLYSSPSFAKYAKLKKAKDTTMGIDIIDPKASITDFTTYLKDLQNAGNTSGDIQAILGSQGIVQDIDIQKAIKGFQDMGQLGMWLEKNPGLAQNVANAATPSNSTASSPGVSATPPVSTSAKSTVDTPSNRFTAQLGQDGKTGGAVTGILGDATKGLFGGVGDLFKLANGDPMAQLGIGAALIYGVYKLFQKVGFFGGIGSLLAIGGVNSGTDIAARIEKLFGGTPTPTPLVGGAAPAPASSGAAAPATSAANAPASTFDVSKLNTEQKKIYTKLSTNGTLVSQINTSAENNKKANKAETGDFNAYMTYIFSDKIQALKLDKLIYTSSPQTGVFGNTGSVDLALGVPSSLDNNTLKYILREYLIGSGPLAVVGGKPQGQKEREEFETKYPSASWGQKTLDDLTKEIHK